MNSAVIGIGNISANHINSIKDLGHHLIAVCDNDVTKLNKFGNINTYTDYIEMLDNENIDVVHICTPHYLHAEMIIECLKRNINVLCEKPLCISEKQISLVLEAEKNSKGILGICQQNRYNPNILYIKDYLKDKKVLTAFASVIWLRDKTYYSQAAWRGKWNTEGGGVLINQALHTLDLMQWLLGMPDEVTAITDNLTHKDTIEVEDSAVLFFKGKNSFSVFATTSSAADLPVEITIKTENELIQIIDDYVLINGNKFNFDTSDPIYGKLCYGSGHKRLIDDFYSHAMSETKFPISGEEASKVIKMILGSYNSKTNRVFL